MGQVIDLFSRNQIHPTDAEMREPDPAPYGLSQDAAAPVRKPEAEYLSAAQTAKLVRPELAAAFPGIKFTRKPRKPGFKVVCLECNTKFTTRSMLPSCPKCGGVDVEPRS